MKDKNIAKKFFKNDIYALETTGIQIEEINETYAVCSLEIKQKHLNAAGLVMGGAIFTLADFTFAVSANSEETKVVSLSSSINFIRPTRGPVLFAKANCVTTGNTISFYEIRVYDDLDRTIATATINGFITD